MHLIQDKNLVAHSSMQATLCREFGSLSQLAVNYAQDLVCRELCAREKVIGVQVKKSFAVSYAQNKK